jgi:hypothetical protein
MKQMDILLKSENRQEAETVLRELREMSPEERRNLLAFMQGMRFAESMERYAPRRML